MKKLFTLGLLVTALTFGVNSAKADDAPTQTVNVTVPTETLLNIVGGTISLTFGAPTAGGADFTAVSNATTYLQVTSVVASSDDHNEITVSASGIPNGISLSVTPTAPASDYEGTPGTVSSTLTLSGTSQTLISEIGSLYTGTGTSDGYNISYSMESDDDNFSSLYSQDATAVTVTYTIQAAS